MGTRDTVHVLLFQWYIVVRHTRPGPLPVHGRCGPTTRAFAVTGQPRRRGTRRTAQASRLIRAATARIWLLCADAGRRSPKWPPLAQHHPGILSTGVAGRRPAAR